MLRKCPNCGKEITDDTVSFCPECGTRCPRPEPWTCLKCGAENQADAKFCVGCGASRSAQEAPSAFRSFAQRFKESPYLKLGAALLVAILFAIGGASYYYNNLDVDHYLAYYAEASRTVDSNESYVADNIKADLLKDNIISDTKSQLQKNKDDLDEIAGTFSKKKPLKGYSEQHKTTLALLQKESALCDQIILVLDKPLDEEAPSVIESLKTDIQDAKAMEDQLDIKNTSFSTGIDLTNVPQQLTSFITEQKRLDEEKKRMEKERQEHQAAINDFFKKMDQIISNYDSAKVDLGAMLESDRKGGMIWADYFNIINNATSARNGIRYQINALKAPAGTEKLQQQFAQVLADSIRYCQLMNISAHLQFNHYEKDAMTKKKEADALDKQVQQNYAAFISNYNATKSSMTSE